MNKQQMVINDVIETIFRIEDKQTKFQDLIEEIKNKYKFPQNAICRIKVDGIEKQNNELVSAYAKQKINVNCSHVIPIQLMHPYLGSITVRADVCQQIIELEKLIAQQLFPIKYEILINDNIPEKNKFLSQINYESLKLKLIASFYVTHENVQKQFRVEAFQQCQVIKQEVFTFFKITDEAELVYNKIPLENQEIFASYMVPLLSEIKIQLKTQITLTIKYNEILHKFTTKKNQKIETIIQSLRKYFSLHQDQKIMLRCRGSNLNPKKTLEESQITQDVTMELKLDPITLQLKVRVYLKGQKIYFLQFVRNNQCVSVLDKILPLQNKVCTYYLGDQLLNKHVSFIENGICDVQEIDLSVDTIEKEQIRVRFEGPQINHVNVQVTDTVQLALKQFNPNNQTITAYYYNKQIKITETYLSLDIHDGDTIVYKLTDQESDYMIKVNDKVEKIKFNSKNTGQQLIEFILKEFKIKNQYKLQYGGMDCPLNKPICDFEEEDQIFEIIQKIPIRIFVESTKRSQIEYFYENQLIEDLKKLIQEQFKQADNIQIIVSIDDQEILSTTELGIFKDKQLDVRFLQQIKLKLVDQDGKLIKEISAERTSCMKTILNSSIDFRCFNNNGLFENDLEIQEVFENETEATVEIEYLKKGKLIEIQNEQNVQDFQFFKDQQIIEVIFLPGKFQIFYDSKLIDENKTFQELNLSNECLLYHQRVIDVQVNNKQGRVVIDKKTYAYHQTIKNIISKHNKYEVEILYQGREQDQNKQLKEFFEENEEIQELTFILTEQILIIIEENKSEKNYKIDRSQTLQYFRKLKEYQDQSKLFYYQGSEVQENVKFSTLYDKKQQVTLKYKPKQQINTELVHQPSVYLPNQINTEQVHQPSIYLPNQINIEQVHQPSIYLPNETNTELIHQPSIYLPNQIQPSSKIKKETKLEQKVEARQNQSPIQQSSMKSNPKPNPSIKIQEVKNQQKQPELKQQKPKSPEEINIKLIIDSENFFYENVDVNMTLRNFISYFEMKKELSSISLFYDGAIVDDQKTFKQLNIKDGDELEIV